MATRQPKTDSDSETAEKAAPPAIPTVTALGVEYEPQRRKRGAGGPGPRTINWQAALGVLALSRGEWMHVECTVEQAGSGYQSLRKAGAEVVIEEDGRLIAQLPAAG